MKKIIILLGLVTVFWSCEDGLTDLNEDTKNPTVVPAGSLFGNAEKNLFDQMTNTNVNRNVFRLFAQHWSETTYLDEANYDILQRNVSDTHWQILYRDVLRDLQEAQKIVTAQTTVTDEEAGIKTNKLAIIELLNVYTYSVLVDTYGDVPYTQALNPNEFPSPAYDDAKTIYIDLFARLNAALASIDTGYDSFGGEDFVYGGDMAAWSKFGNSLKLRMAITVADEPTMAALSQTSAVEAVTAGVFTSSADNATLQYKSTQPNTNPLYEDLVSSGRYDFVAAEPLVTRMNTYNDPRRDNYFVPIDGVFVGAPYAEGVDFESYSSPGDPAGDGPYTRLLDPTLEGLLLDYTEVEFYLAEAAARGYAVGGTAESYYNEAITSSIIYWDGTAAEAADYLAQPDVVYGGGDWKQRIGEQSWISYYNRGFEAWTVWRRLDYPLLTAPATAVPASEGIIPKRFTYPVREQTLNGTNYTAAGDAVGGDRLKTKIFWDKF